MHRRPNAAGVSPRAARPGTRVEATHASAIATTPANDLLVVLDTALELLNELELEPPRRQLVERLQEVRAVHLVAAGTLVLDVRARVQQVVDTDGGLQVAPVELEDLADPDLQGADRLVEDLAFAAIRIRETDRGRERVGLRGSVCQRNGRRSKARISGGEPGDDRPRVVAALILVVRRQRDAVRCEVLADH